MKRIEVEAKRENFPSGESWKAFQTAQPGWDWHYNLSRKCWGYGDDARDWSVRGEKFLADSEIQEIDYKDGEEKAIIYYEEEV